LLLRNLIIAGAVVVSTALLALGQLTPEQVLLKEELQNRPPANVTDIEKYNSQISLTNQNPDFYIPPEGSQPPASISQGAQTGQSDGLRIFGYNMFDGSPESFSPILEATPPPDYKLGPGDNILVNIWGRVDMQLDLTIDREGKIFIPKVGEIPVWGVTLDAFRALLESRLSIIYSDYKLSISLGKIRRIKVFVYGEVKRPGGYTTSSLTTLFNVLYLAGGPTQTGSLRTIKQIRNSQVLSQIDLYRFLTQGDNSQDSKLESGDVVFVPVVGPLVKISGQVKRPAIYEIRGGEKVSDLIELAGSPTAEAFLEKISIDRVGLEDSRIIQDINLSETARIGDPELFTKADLSLKDGDEIRIPSIFDLRKNTVKLMGNVKHPGMFGLVDSMTVIDLIDHGEQLQHNTHLERANLFRTFPDQRREVYQINLAAILQGADSTNFLLIDKDSLVVYSENEIKRDKVVSIYGAVKRPGTYEFFENMKLSDLIFLGGNPLRQSYLLQAEIARINPGKPSEVIFANLEKVLNEEDSSEDFFLREDDKVFVRTIPRWQLDNNVIIEGEVMFPGPYMLTKEDEKLSDLFQRCGGFTPDAFIEGIVFVRSTITEDVEKRQVRDILAATEQTILDTLNRPLPKLNQTLDLSKVSRIVINPREVLKNHKSPDNIKLQKGDYVFVPRAPAGVQVLGAVGSVGTVAYKKNKNLGYFIKSSGGYSRDADKSQTRLAKANGRVLGGTDAFNSRVEPGDMIVVPQKIKREKQWFRSATSLAAIASSALTAYFILDKVR